jgi:hypothetical protein
VAEFLDRGLRRQLERTCVAARDDAELAVGDAFAVYGVTSPDRLKDDVRNRARLELRKRAIQIGNGRSETLAGYVNESALGKGLPHLREELAYEIWHRFLFARFLAETGQLIPAEYGVPVSMAECNGLAEEGTERDGWDVAIRIAAERLPGLFHPTFDLQIAPEARQKLIAHVESLPEQVFTATDSLGWVYQFWQKKKKDEVNASERKIGGADLSPVTQLFTEDYIVRFLLENTLGAWWWKRHPESPQLAEWEYLRFRNDGTPAAGNFDGWPDELRQVTVVDPCCGSGHFLVAAFGMLHRMRVEEYGESSAEAADAVLREQLFGLELDARCTQIATFAVALAAWRVGGHPEAVVPHIACSGIPVAGQLADWKRAAQGDAKMTFALEQLHQLFLQAPTLGSLIDPTSVTGKGEVFNVRWEDIERSLERVQTQLAADDPSSGLFGGDALAATRAMSLLARKYTLVATNVPYLSRGNHSDALKEYADKVCPEAKADLATMFIQRCQTLATTGERGAGSIAVVSPQNWLFLGSYRAFRKGLLDTTSFGALSILGEKGFESAAAAGAFTSLAILDNSAPPIDHTFSGIDASSGRDASVKDDMLRSGPLTIVSQSDQRRNPDERISLEILEDIPLLSAVADCYQGISTGDFFRNGRCIWELASIDNNWAYKQSTVSETTPYGGKSEVIRWVLNKTKLATLGYGAIRGRSAWGQKGIVISQMRDLEATLYTGSLFDNNAAVIVPHVANSRTLSAIWCFCSSHEFNAAVRRMDSKLWVTNASLVKVPFDLERWTKVAEERYPNGLPEPHSDDPTQWLFKGDIASSEAPMQVAVARLLGYRWPEQPDDDTDGVDALADPDGIVCLPGLNGEQPAADRLRAVLESAYGDAWSARTMQRLLDDVGFGGMDLAAWLADKKGFFAQHVKLFHNRPFIWQISDGQRGGFSALVNYHRLNRDALNNLIYVYLDDWIGRQEQALQANTAGAEALLNAARGLRERLIAIERGEPPYDIYVRWKSLAEQPMGWEPDLNDGVRLNIRPFVEAKALHAPFSINWNKDRGKDPVQAKPDLSGVPRDRQEAFAMHASPERFNDLHFTLEEKRRAREAGTSTAATGTASQARLV